MIRLRSAAQTAALVEQLVANRPCAAIDITQMAAGTLSLSTAVAGAVPVFRCYIRPDGRVSEPK